KPAARPSAVCTGSGTSRPGMKEMPQPFAQIQPTTAPPLMARPRRLTSRLVRSMARTPHASCRAPRMTKVTTAGLCSAWTRTAPALTRERVIDAAIALAEREGLGELSMRRLAVELGSGTMSLYNHVADKDDLLDGMVEQVLAGVRVSSSPDWRDVAATWATDS